MKRFISLLTCAMVLSILASCGGGNTGSTMSPASAPGRGSVSVTINWPAKQRLIPNASESIVITISQGSTQLQQQVLQRPSGSGTTIGTFKLLPTGALTANATAYPNTNGTGTAQAAATVPITIQANQNTPSNYHYDEQYHQSSCVDAESGSCSGRLNSADERCCIRCIECNNSALGP